VYGRRVGGVRDSLGWKKNKTRRKKKSVERERERERERKKSNRFANSMRRSDLSGKWIAEKIGGIIKRNYLRLIWDYLFRGIKENIDFIIKNKKYAFFSL